MLPLPFASVQLTSVRAAVQAPGPASFKALGQLQAGKLVRFGAGVGQRRGGTGRAHQRHTRRHERDGDSVQAMRDGHWGNRTTNRGPAGRRVRGGVIGGVRSGRTAHFPDGRSSVGRPANETLASLKLGGPMNPFAWFDATAPSDGNAEEPGAAFAVPILVVEAGDRVDGGNPFEAATIRRASSRRVRDHF